MTAVSYRGVVRDGVVVLREKETPLPEGTEVLVPPVAGAPGSPAGVLAAVDNSLGVPAGWVDELEQLIAQGRRPATRHDPFPDDLGGREGQ